MGISETKKQIVIDNYFKNTCDVNTSIKEAFTKGFEVGLTKAVYPKADYENRLKADLKAILVELQLEIEESENCGKAFHLGLQMASNIIQEKINALGGNKNA